MTDLEKAKLLSIAEKFANATKEDIRKEITEQFSGKKYQIERAKIGRAHV